MCRQFTDILVEWEVEEAALLFEIGKAPSDERLSEIAAQGAAAARILQRRQSQRLAAQARPGIEGAVQRDKRYVLKTIKGSHMSADYSEMQPYVRIAVEELMEEGLVVEKARKDGKRILQYRKPDSK